MDNIKVTINYRGKKSSINQLTKNLRDFDFEFEKVDPTHLQMSTEYDNTTSVGRQFLTITKCFWVNCVTRLPTLVKSMVLSGKLSYSIMIVDN